MHIRTTTDPISLNDVPDPGSHPRLDEGDEVNGLEIYFETEENKQAYMDMELPDHKVIQGSDSEDYVAQG